MRCRRPSPPRRTVLVCRRVALRGTDDPLDQGGWTEPEDPLDQGGWTEPEDPLDQGGWTEPEDPLDQGGWTEPEDPLDQGGWTEPEDPLDQGGWTEPEDPSATGGCGCAEGGRRRPAFPLCPGPPRVPPRGERPGSPGGGARTNGRLVVRLAADLPSTGTGDLGELAAKLGLGGLAELLREHQLASAPLVAGAAGRRVAELEAKAAASELPPLRSLSSYWRIDVRGLDDGAAEELVARLRVLPGVDHAYRELAGSDPGVTPGDDPHSAAQGYLDPAPVGIDAGYAWSLDGGRGEEVSLVDLEQGWFPEHQDLVARAASLIHGDDRSGVGTYRGHHGTAVLGELVASDNALGIVGIAPGVRSVRLASHYDAATATSGLVAEAVVAAAAVLDAGDVLLLEVQKGFLPTEVEDADFDAIRLASALGIIVVAAAGNGGGDLDRFVDVHGRRPFAGGSPDCRDSGAILVAAARATAPHDRLASSNYGSAIDCYAWGEDVTTCGYGDLDAGGGDHETYTACFANTSAAAPIVAGAALLVQSRYQRVTGGRLSPAQMRALLSDPTLNTPQGRGVVGSIGVMPDLAAILGRGLGLAPDVYGRDHLGDDGSRPGCGPRGTSPDVIVRAKPVADPAAAFGVGSGTEGSERLAARIEPGKDHALYVRLANRGSGVARGATATVYWSEAATLVTPERWHRIGTTEPVDVPQGDVLTVAGPLGWKAEGLPADGHCVFLAVLDQAHDPAPPFPLASPHFDWRAFRRWQRRSNNVVRRGFAVVERTADRRQPLALPFLLAGTPRGDRARSFDLEVVQRLPAGARVWLEVPVTLRHQLGRSQLLEVEVDRQAGVARLAVPGLPRYAFCWLRLAAGARHRCRLLVRGGDDLGWGGHSVAVRQLWRGEEVGRFTWEIASRRPLDRG